MTLEAQETPGGGREALRVDVCPAQQQDGRPPAAQAARRNTQAVSDEALGSNR